MISLTFPDGSKKDAKEGVTPLEVAKGIGEGLARDSISAEVNGKLVDVNSQIKKDAKIRLLTLKDKEGLEILRHSCAHTLAQAVKRLYPKAQQTIGPVIENGFMFDFDNLDITNEDLPKIEEEMHKVVKEKYVTKRKDYANAEEAKRDYKDNPYKIELIDEHSEEGLSRYDQGEYHDLCRGPHAPDTSWPSVFKLTKVAKAYWRGDSQNKQLTRIYGFCFAKKSELDSHLKLLEEAEKRDHRKLGKELKLLMFHEYSPGAPFFLPKGAFMYNKLLDFLRSEYEKRGYVEVVTPLLYDKELWETSGHWEHYKQHMFLSKVEGREFSLKPMNCPSHMLVYMNETRSYRDLPLRIADFAPIHRNELSGTLSGLTRVRKFVQDDAHVFCMPEQLRDEIEGMMNFVKYVFHEVFKMDYRVEISTRPEKFMGEPEAWDKAERSLSDALDELGVEYTINEGDGAFYGPKIDVHVEDVIGRSHQCSTIQVDFQMPSRFRVTYEGPDGQKHTPVVIHRTILGSIERFLGLMIEHFEGRFPLWISPEQVRVLPIADRHNAYSALVIEKLKKSEFRATLDDRHLTTNKKVREAELEKVNYILVVGDKEQNNKTVNVRTRENKILGEKNVDEFLNDLVSERSEKR